MRVFRDSDVDLNLIKGRKVAVIGYGAQGHAHALNLRDSGVTEIAVGLRPGSASAAETEQAGFRVLSVAEAAQWADVVMVLTPDEGQADLYSEHLAPNMKPGAALAFAHGFAIHFKLIKPRPDLDVFMAAPKGQGRAVRAEYQKGSGVPCLIAVAQNATGKAFDLALSYAAAIGSGRAGILETTFRDECESDLFSEQVVLCGGLSHLVTGAFETLVEAGYAPEVAWLECLYEVKLIADLMYVNGIAATRRVISNTAEYGDYTRGPRIVTDETRAEMKRILDDIQSGRFAREWMQEYKAGMPTVQASRRRAAEHEIEKVGERLREAMPSLIRT